ncbi:protein spire homolog 2 [Denticeps clupeoides]|uniref:protein spire homolog 2 n=1 Tax=Denticeps clupeoides TaxID=299321 RepID=UPI0010A2C56C|nr:protein spire homolog 2-like [Denticeps clupeoides]
MENQTCVSLSEILELQNQPVTEEEAWALCHQLSSLLKAGGPGTSWSAEPRRAPRPPPRAGDVLLSGDGGVHLRDTLFCQTEEQVVDYLGRLVYSCLDWGLGGDVERDLGDTLALLVSRMTRVGDTLHGACTLAEVIRVCEYRLCDPAQAAQHYRTVCFTLLSEALELFHLLQSIKCATESLQESFESEASLLTNVTSHSTFAWKYVVEEMKTGVMLKPCEDPHPVESLPAGLDRQLKLQTLRKVQDRHVGEITDRMVNPQQALLEYVRSRPKLKPVSERKLKEKPKEDVSLHEQLMQEIRSANQLKLLSSSKKRRAFQNDASSEQKSERSSCVDSPKPGYPIKPASVSRPLEDEFFEGTFSQIGTPDNSAVDSKFGDKDSKLSEERKKRRAQSFGSNNELHKTEKKAEVRAPLTIPEVIKAHESGLKTMPYNSALNWRVCSCCLKRSQYFTWHNVCSLCNRVMCPECCVVMQLPYKWCLKLPITFFKKIVLNKSSEHALNQFWSERLSWDCSRVPLVLESPVLDSRSLHSLAMRDWHSQDACIRCRGLLLEACDSVFSLCSVTGPQEI